MRIIAGTHRSRKILPPPDDRTTRPITDRVKQSVFDRLVALELMGGNVLDVFAGTGSLGLESLSRDADHCTFVERDRTARELLERNLADLGLADRATVLGGDALAGAWLPMIGYKPARVVFCDPPYALTTEPAALARMAQLIAACAPYVEPEGALLLRTDETVKPPPVVGWDEPVTVSYGSMLVHFYRRPALPGAVPGPA